MNLEDLVKSTQYLYEESINITEIVKNSPQYYFFQQI